jgi:peptidyl-prolyl cis-trans isomerase C
MTIDTLRASALARINGVALHATDDKLSPDELRQRACTELLRQTAQAAGLLDANDAPSADGVISEAAADAIDTLLEQNLNMPGP